MSRDMISLGLIESDPEQPRKHFDAVALAELAQSMQEKGLIIPVLVRPAGGRFVLVHGERRCRAAQALRWETIPAEVRDISPDEARWLSLIENIQRADLSPIEEAQAYRERLSQRIATMLEDAERKGTKKPRTLEATEWLESRRHPSSGVLPVVGIAPRPIKTGEAIANSPSVPGVRPGAG